jgi:hypothetical protein
MSATKTALRQLARKAQYLAEQIARLDDLLTPLVTDTAPELVACYGVGTDTAGALLIAAGRQPRPRSTTTQRLLICAPVAPIPASSGNTTRHRLNRGGDRQGQPCAVADRDHPYVRRPPNPRLRRPAHRRGQVQAGGHALSHWLTLCLRLAGLRVVLLGVCQGTASLPRRSTASLPTAAPGAPGLADRHQGHGP